MRRAQPIARIAEPEVRGAGGPAGAAQRFLVNAGRLTSPSSPGRVNATARARRTAARTVQPSGLDQDAVEVVTGREPAMRRLAEFMGSAQRDLVVIDAGLEEAHLPRSLVRVVATQGVQVRSIYPRRLLLAKGDDHESPVKILPGEQARMLVSVPATCLLVDLSAAAAPIISNDGQVAGLLVIGPSCLLDIAVGLAESLWQQAVPAEHHGSSVLSPDDVLLLNLLQQGLKDRAIARALGIAERTVQRRLSALMVELGAKTRFQAALNAVRLGWL